MESMIDHTRQRQMVITSLTTTAIAVLVLALRFISRKWVSHYIGVDDWLMVAAGGIMVVFCILNVYNIRHGEGLHIFDIAPSDLESLLKVQFAIEMFYYFSVYLIKLSVLAFYLRLIPPATKTRSMIWITIWCLTIYSVIHLFVTCLQCIPIAAAWDISLPAKCINLTLYFYSSAVFNIITDVVIVALPMKHLASMSLSITDKILVIGVFAFIFVACIISCIRVYAIKILVGSDDRTWDIIPLANWSHLEVFFGILCSSAPALKPLLSKIKVLHSKSKGKKATESSADT